MLEWIAAIFHTTVYQPLFNILILLYVYIPGHDFGLAVILLTIGARLALYPITRSAIASQKALSDLQPKIKEVQDRWKNDKERQVKEPLALYQTAKVNPFAAIFPVLVQLPLLIALFRLFGQKIDGTQLTSSLYGFVPFPADINFFFLGLINLAQPNIIFAFMSGILQFWQVKMLQPQEKKAAKQQGGDMGQMMQKQMTYFFPALTVLILLRLPSAMGLYWACTTVFSIGQQYLILNKKPAPAKQPTC